MFVTRITVALRWRRPSEAAIRRSLLSFHADEAKAVFLDSRFARWCVFKLAATHVTDRRETAVHVVWSQRRAERRAALINGPAIYWK